MNRGTNLILHTASQLYERKLYSEAAELLESHLEKFSTNPAAQILLSKCCAQLGKYHQAIELLKSASQAIHSPATFDFYLKEIEDIQRKEIVDIRTEKTNTIGLKIPDMSTEQNFTNTGTENTYEQFLVSETLAKIYISQGEIKEAVGIYEKLIELKPENKEKYQQSIDELNSRLEK